MICGRISVKKAVYRINAAYVETDLIAGRNKKDKIPQFRRYDKVVTKKGDLFGRLTQMYTDARGRYRYVIETAGTNRIFSGFYDAFKLACKNDCQICQHKFICLTEY